MGWLHSFLLFSFGSNCLSYKVDGLQVEEIIGGEIASINQFKHVVALVYNSGGQVFIPRIECSGSIISSWHIITAAHCFYDIRSRYYKHKEFYIIVSATDVWMPLNRTEYIRVELIIIPDFYNPLTSDMHTTVGNLAIVKLALELGLHQGHRFLKKLRIGRDSFAVRNKSCIVAGYGWNQITSLIRIENGIINNIQTGQTDGKLRFANAYILDDYICWTLLEADLLYGNMCVKIIQELDDRKGICQGDSGSPLFRGNFLVGIAIDGSPECNENRRPGLYINVPTYRSFIISVLENKMNEQMRVLELRQRSLTEFYFAQI